MSKCKCGCGTDVKGTWARGHHARVNNPSRRDDVRSKQGAASKRRAAAGELKGFSGWNRGLSVETDARVAAYGAKISRRIDETPGRREQMSAALKGLWEEGKWHRTVGADTSSWKGGASSLQQRCRATLYAVWSRPIMVRDGFQCQRCHSAKGGDLVVHHDVERFAAIIHRVVAGRDVSLMSFEEQGAVVENIVRDHLERDVHGTTLCRPCHAAVHAVDPDVD